MCAEQVDRRRILGDGVVHIVQCVDDLEKCLPGGIAASGKAGRHCVRIHPQRLKGLGGGVAAILDAQVKFLDRITHLID